MARIRILIAALLFAFGATPAGAALITSNGGATVDDTTQGITWLANANLAAIMPLGVTPCGGAVTSDCVNKSGTMDYAAAVQWVFDLNSSAYQGHTNWQLPTTA